MIKEFRLVNWKSFEDAKLFVDPLTFLIGTNASGKSNILDAFQFLQRIASGIAIQSAINGDRSIHPLRGGTEWIIRQGQCSCSLGIKVHINKTDYEYEIEMRKIEQGIELVSEKLKGNRDLFWTDRETAGHAIMPAYFHTGKNGKPKRIDVNRNYCVLSQVDKLHVNKDVKDVAVQVNETLKNIFILDPIPNHMRGFSKLSDQLAPDAGNIAGVLAALEETKRKQIEDKLTNYLRPLPEKDIKQVFVELVGRFRSDAMLYCKENWTGDNIVEVDARGMSDGTLRFLAIITAILLGKTNRLLIVEEIDNGLHPSRAKNLVAMLKELSSDIGIDILCTTHNPALINTLGNEMISFISCVKRNENSGNSEIVLLEDINNLPKLMSMNSVGELMTKGILH